QMVRWEIAAVPCGTDQHATWLVRDQLIDHQRCGIQPIMTAVVPPQAEVDGYRTLEHGGLLHNISHSIHHGTVPIAMSQIIRHDDEVRFGSNTFAMPIAIVVGGCGGSYRGPVAILVERINCRTFACIDRCAVPSLTI